MALIAVGVVGIFVCIMVAALGVASTKNSSILVAYSCCSVLFSFAFIGIGCVFFIIAMLSTGQVDVGDPGVQLLLKDCPAWSALYLKTGADFDTCLVKATCDAVKFWQGKFQTVGFGIGIPYFLAGILMFVAMYACCCCKQHFGEQEDSSPVEFTATAASQMQGQEQDDFPGAEFYPAPGKNKPKPQAMGYPGGQDPQNQVSCTQPLGLTSVSRVSCVATRLCVCVHCFKMCSYGIGGMCCCPDSASPISLPYVGMEPFSPRWIHFTCL